MVRRRRALATQQTTHARAPIDSRQSTGCKAHPRRPASRSIERQRVRTARAVTQPRKAPAGQVAAPGNATDARRLADRIREGRNRRSGIVGLAAPEVDRTGCRMTTTSMTAQRGFGKTGMDRTRKGESPRWASGERQGGTQRQAAGASDVMYKQTER